MALFSRQFFLLQLGYFVFSLGGASLKFASRHPLFSPYFVALCSGSLLCVFLFALIWQQVLQKYDLMVAYAWRGTTFLWTFLWAVLFFGESITLSNIIGAAIIVAGMIMVVRDE